MLVKSGLLFSKRAALLVNDKKNIVIFITGFLDIYLSEHFTLFFLSFSITAFR